MSFAAWAQAAKTFAEGTGRVLEQKWINLQRQEEKLKQRQFEADRYVERLEAGYEHDIDVRDERRGWNKIQSDLAKDEAKVLKGRQDVEKSWAVAQGEMGSLFAGLGKVSPQYDRDVQALSARLQRAKKAGVLFDIYGEAGLRDPAVSDVIELRGEAGRVEPIEKPTGNIIYRGTSYPVATFIRQMEKIEDQIDELEGIEKGGATWAVSEAKADPFEQRAMVKEKPEHTVGDVDRDTYIALRWRTYSKFMQEKLRLEAELKERNRALDKTATIEGNNALKRWHSARPE